MITSSHLWQQKHNARSHGTACKEGRTLRGREAEHNNILNGTHGVAGRTWIKTRTGSRMWGDKEASLQVHHVRVDTGDHEGRKPDRTRWDWWGQSAERESEQKRRAGSSARTEQSQEVPNNRRNQTALVLKRMVQSWCDVEHIIIHNSYYNK